MLRWIPYAFVRIVIFFCAGIVPALFYPDSLPEDFAQPFLFGLSVCYILLASFKRWLKIDPSLAGLITLSLTGYVAVQLKTDTRQADHIIHLSEPVEYYSAVVTKPAEEKANTWKLEASMLQVKTTRWLVKEGKILLYLSKKAYDEPFRYGDVLLIKGKLERVKGPANPGEFDYKRFLAFRQIYHQAFLRENDVVYLENSPPNKFLNYAIRARTWADGTMKKYIPGKREQALASALVLGVTEGLDNDLLNAYAATGATHILSVSGLHVGIIYWMVLLLFKPFEKIKGTKWIQALVSLLVLWAYAFVTGISPSVLRAVTMFSFVAIARPWNWKTNIYNSLAASAFFLLLYDPYMIMSVGFQLSYLAVVGIVGMQPALYRLWEPESRILDELWKVSAVSIAAQLATFSLGLLYFHQFPNYFLLANLVVIPASFVILVVGVVMMAVASLTPLAQALGWLLTWIMKIMNEFVFFVERIPFSLIENIQISTLQCFILLLCTGLWIGWTETKKVIWLYPVCGLVVMFSVGQWFHFKSDVAVRKITVYDVPGHTAIDFSGSGKAFFLSDSVLRSDNQKIRFHILPNRVRGGIKEVYGCEPFYRQLDGCALMAWGNRTFLQIQKEHYQVPPDTGIDFLIISNNAVKDLGSLVAMVKAKEIILDSSNAFRTAGRILSEGRKLNGKIFSVLHQGAFEITL